MRSCAHRFQRLMVLAVIAGLTGPVPAGAQEPGPSVPAAVAAAQTLKGLTIEQLMTIDVTTANRREEPLGTTPAAISVITRDDIRRMGVTTIADALTLADGVHVARFNNGTWAITARGFNQNAANKLLVMVDGRTEYSPLFTGVFWNTLDYVLEDIDRIEVIRGPGAALWGANAVNGVVNIITRSARETAGGLATVSGGNEDPGIASVRYGMNPSRGPAWRVYGKFAGRDAQQWSSGVSSGDAIRRGQSGFRLDGGASAGTTWLLKGDLFHSRNEFPDRPDGEYTNGSMQARWSTPLTSTSRLTVQSYYRREHRAVPLQLTHTLDTVDVDAQHRWEPPRHELVWGGGFRVNTDSTEGAVFGFVPVERTYRVANVFAQDTVAAVPGRLFATVGAKLEHNAFSGSEFQPNARARVHLPRNQMVWGAVSRAVRRPTRFEDDLIVRDPAGTIVVQGSDAFEAESLVALEAGYRAPLSRVLSVDVTVFRHRIGNLRSQEAPVAGIAPVTIGNSLIGRAHGLETALNVQPLSWWRTHASYTWMDTSIARAAGSRDVSGGVNEANDPDHQFSLRSSVDLPAGVEFDLLLRSIGALPAPAVPSFTELSLRLGWVSSRRFEIWLAGQDLLHARHPEFGAPLPTRVEFERSIRSGVAVRF